MSKRNILREAFADSRALKEAAYENAQMVLMESLKDQVKDFVDSQLNESVEEAYTEEEEADETAALAGAEEEGEDMDDDTGLDFEESDEESEDDVEDAEEMDEGLTEEDLEEALQSALSEVSHGDLGEMDFVGDSTERNPTGLEDLDSREDGWEAKEAPASREHPLTNGDKYHQESRRYRAKVAALVKENTLLRRAYKQIKEALNETRLFNTKLFYATKLMKETNLSPKTKASVMRKIDGVTSLAEAKNLYESLQLALGELGERRPARKSRPLTEALGSTGPGAGITQSRKKEMVSESAVRRNKVLAGIIKE